MLVGELILRKKLLKDNIRDVQKALSKKEKTYSKVTYNGFLDSLFGYIEQIKSHDILLNRSNEKTIIVIGKNKVNVSDAVFLRDSVMNKINILSSMIDNNTNVDLDIFNLIEERDKLLDEFVYLNNLINVSDWTTEIQ